jgi:hypothetical protein
MTTPTPALPTNTDGAPKQQPWLKFVAQSETKKEMSEMDLKLGVENKESVRLDLTSHSGFFYVFGKGGNH